MLYRTLNESVWTDLSLDQIVSLALLAQNIPRENIVQKSTKDKTILKRLIDRMPK